jgi:glycosyltransferase involved in cell wall biosynthesis
MKISAVMMVKNEEKLLPQALTSLVGIADELIIVDTGSTDKTVDIAKAFGAKVFHSPWRNDFSFHRNESIEHAQGDWLLIIDADEKLVKTPLYQNKKNLIKWIQKVEKKYKTIALVVKDYQNDTMSMNCNSARLFKKGFIHYENKVHNAPIFPGAAVLCDLITLEHYGYDLSPEKMQAKFDRTYNLLLDELKDVDENGVPKNKDTYFYLCQLLGHHNRQAESREWGFKYLDLKSKLDKNDFNRTIYFTLIKSCLEDNLMKDAYRLIIEASKETPHDPDIACALADYGATTNNHYIMAEGCRRYIKGYKEMMEDPSKKAGQFYFTLRDDQLTLNLYRLCIASLGEGMEAWQHLKGRLNGSVEIIDELKTNLDKIGCGHLKDEIEEHIDALDEQTIQAKAL